VRRRHGRHAAAGRALRTWQPALADHSTLRRAVGGDRPYVLAFFILLAVLSMLVVGPLQSYTAAAERVRDLEMARAELQQRVGDLQMREGRLHDPEEVELLARRKLGLVRPGEIPYVVSDGSPDTDQVRPDGRAPEPLHHPSLFERLATAFASLFSR
jgi:cell division protein FtsB